MDVDHWMDEMDERLEDWILGKQSEAKDTFHEYPYPVIRAIMFAALYEQGYALDLMESRNLDERHMHAVCETEYCEEFFQKEMNHNDDGE